MNCSYVLRKSTITLAGDAIEYCPKLHTFIRQTTSPNCCGVLEGRTLFQFHFGNVALAAQAIQWLPIVVEIVGSDLFDALGFMSGSQEALTNPCHKPESIHTFLDHAEIARHSFCFLNQGSETSPDTFSPERFAPGVEIKRSEQLNHVLR